MPTDAVVSDRQKSMTESEVARIEALATVARDMPANHEVVRQFMEAAGDIVSLAQLARRQMIALDQAATAMAANGWDQLPANPTPAQVLANDAYQIVEEARS